MPERTLWRYTPSLADPVLLEDLFVQRENLLERLEKLVVDSATTRSMHFVLMVGGRGTGKTHLFSMLDHRLRSRRDLDDRLRVARLPEDPWRLTTPTHLFEAAARSLAARHGLREIDERLQRLVDVPRDHAEQFARSILTDAGAGHTLLLMIENLDEVFANLGDRGQKALRAFFQEERNCAVVATTRALTPDLASRDAPFFGFFGAEQLEPLTTASGLDLLLRIARAREDHDLVQALETPLGAARIRAFDELAAGNPRLYALLGSFLTSTNLDTLATPVLQTLDELTPHYREAMSSLSPQQRMIVAYLCDRRGAAPVKQIARECFITEQTTSSQLKELRERRFVTDHRVGRESWYELRDPLMGLGLSLRRGGADACRALVALLRSWHDPELDDAPIADLLRLTPTEAAWRAAVPNLLARPEDHAPLGAALVRGLGLLADPMLSDAARQAWGTLWQEHGSGHEGLDPALRLLSAGVAYLTQRERRALLALPAIERRIAVSALAVEELAVLTDAR